LKSLPNPCAFAKKYYRPTSERRAPTQLSNSRETVHRIQEQKEE
jgi:hypothetical protein